MPETLKPDELVRPIIGIENRTAQEVFEIMRDRFRHASALQSDLAQAKQDAADARANFLTMQGTAAELLKRAEKAEAAFEPGGNQWRMRVKTDDGWSQWCDWRDGNRQTSGTSKYAEYQQRQIYAAPDLPTKEVGK